MYVNFWEYLNLIEKLCNVIGYFDVCKFIRLNCNYKIADSHVRIAFAFVFMTIIFRQNIKKMIFKVFAESEMASCKCVFVKILKKHENFANNMAEVEETFHRSWGKFDKDFRNFQESSKKNSKKKI